MLTHIALHVCDIQKSISFYTQWCGMRVVHSREAGKVVWLASPGYEGKFVIVLMSGGPKAKPTPRKSAEHLGFAVESKAKVKELAERAKAENILHWDYMELDYPAGTLCGVYDPDGNIVEFSYGQPIGPE